MKKKKSPERELMAFMEKADGYTLGKDGKMKELKSDKSLLEIIQTVLDHKNELIEELRDDVDELKSNEAYDKLKKKYDSLYEHSLLIFSDKELKDYETFKDKHFKKCKNSGHYIIDLTGTGLGYVIKIKCPICGEEKDITDTKSW